MSDYSNGRRREYQVRDDLIASSSKGAATFALAAALLAAGVAHPTQGDR